MAAGATGSRSPPICGPALASSAAAPAPRLSAILETVAARIIGTLALGIDTFILSGYPHLEEAYRFAELVMPLLPLRTPAARPRIEANMGPFGETIANAPTAGKAGRPRMTRRAGRPGMSDGLAQLRRTALTWAVPVALLIVWEIASRSGLISARLMPAPSAVAQAAWTGLRDGSLAPSHRHQHRARPARPLIGGSIGFAFGIANGIWRSSETLFDSTLQMLRNIPPLADHPARDPVVRH